MVGLAPAGSSTWADGDGVADIHGRQVDGDLLGDFAGGHDQLDLAADHGQHAAAADAGGFFLADELDGDEQVDLGVAAQAHQVEMRRQVFHDVALHVAADDADVVMPVDLEVEEGRLEATVLQLLEQDVERNFYGKRIDVATKNDTRNHVLAAHCTSGALACPPCVPGREDQEFLQPY